jgi:hypothetical protein
MVRTNRLTLFKVVTSVMCLGEMAAFPCDKRSKNVNNRKP